MTTSTLCPQETPVVPNALVRLTRGQVVERADGTCLLLEKGNYDVEWRDDQVLLETAGREVVLVPRKEVFFIKMLTP